MLNINFWLKIFSVIILARNQTACPLNKYCRPSGLCWNFTSLNELTSNMTSECFDAHSELKACYFHISQKTTIFRLNFMSYKPLIWDQNFDFYSLKKMMHLYLKRTEHGSVLLDINNVDTIDLTKIDFVLYHQDQEFRYGDITIRDFKISY